MLFAAATARARYATTVPIQPTEQARCTASVSFRTGGDIVTAVAALRSRAVTRRRPVPAAFPDGRRRGVPTTSVTPRAVVAAQTGEHGDEGEQDNGEGDDPEDLHPAWRAGGRRFHGSAAKLSRHYASVKTWRLARAGPNLNAVPKLWSETIEAHRRDVRAAVLDTTAALVAEHGLLSVTMSRIAEETGIGRATLYKYFPDVEALLIAWHERQIAGHLERLARVRDQGGTPGQRLAAVLHAYALIAHESRGHHDTELAALMHRDEQVARAEQRLRHMLRDLVTEAAVAGDIRDDVDPEELVKYCLHALTAASGLPSKAAVRRLVGVTLAGLRSPH